MKERLKVESGLQKGVRLFILRFMNDTRACQTFSQQLPTSDGWIVQSIDATGSVKQPVERKQIICSQEGREIKSVLVYPLHRKTGGQLYISKCKTCP